MKKTEEVIAECAPPTLLDQLRKRRADIVRVTNAKTREIDRAINALSAADAENVIAQAKEILNDV